MAAMSESGCGDHSVSSDPVCAHHVTFKARGVLFDQARCKPVCVYGCNCGCQRLKHPCSSSISLPCPGFHEKLLPKQGLSLAILSSCDLLLLCRRPTEVEVRWGQEGGEQCPLVPWLGLGHSVASHPGSKTPTSYFSASLSH